MALPRLPKLPALASILRPGRRLGTAAAGIRGVESFQRRPTVGRRGIRQEVYGPDPLEARAAQDVEGTLPERIVIEELRRRRINFEFQTSQEGGRLVVEGQFVDFLILDRDPVIALEVLSDWNRPPLGDPSRDAFKAAVLEAHGYRYEALWDDQDIYPSRMRLEQRLDEILGIAVNAGEMRIGGGAGGLALPAAPSILPGEDTLSRLGRLEGRAGEWDRRGGGGGPHGHTHRPGGTDDIGLVSYLVLAADVSTTLAGLATTPVVFTVPVLPRQTYLIEVFLVVTTAASTTGYNIYFDGPASPTQLIITVRGQTGTTTASEDRYYANSYQLGYDSGFLGANTGNNPVFATVFLVNGANGGNVTVIIRSEIAGSAVTAIKGSMARVTRMRQ